VWRLLALIGFVFVSDALRVDFVPFALTPRPPPVPPPYADSSVCSRSWSTLGFERLRCGKGGCCGEPVEAEEKAEVGEAWTARGLAAADDEGDDAFDALYDPMLLLAGEFPTCEARRGVSVTGIFRPCTRICPVAPSLD
jgi:hypothetical protein